MSSIEAAVKQLSVKTLNRDYRSLELYINLTCKTSIENEKAYEDALGVVIKTLENLQNMPDKFFAGQLASRQKTTEMCMRMLGQINERFGEGEA